MRLYNAIVNVWKFLAVLAVLSSTYIYLYPAVHGCGFPRQGDGTVAPFRLLALADPQLEGDTSLPKRGDRIFPSLQRLYGDGGFSLGGLSEVTKELVFKDVPKLLSTIRKRIDLFGNDYYLAHVYRTVSWWTRPSHVVVLGDLLGSQWMNDEEFSRRSERFWSKTFKGASKVPDNLFDYVDKIPQEGIAWSKTLIAAPGNHDIGYAGDLDEATVKRFEKRFGKMNWWTTFGLENGQLNMLTRNEAAFAEGPRLNLVILNSMNLDSPVHSKALQEDTTKFLDEQIGHASRQSYLDATVLMTHIPLYKREGLCVDGPFFTHWPSDQGGGIKEQNHLTEKSSRTILDGMFHLEKNWARAGIILNGHDHEGCNIVHGRGVAEKVEQNMSVSSINDWTSLNYESAKKIGVQSEHSVQEVTVRSMMGAYGGNAGLS
ncbi:hypothetical protein CAC42_2775 [Sphaceloma murrayae]|uniref:Calcineurin-like phosphoesterase domain-containing protein n=1 Tax=Sphaceloma murrayae TaxID=2082308 RepID=A0A2K1R0M0_9PEZI|nr:hypothetical protein CAC42_2775 [Sphaceloma murrayae]